DTLSFMVDLGGSTDAPSRYWEDIPGEFDIEVSDITGTLPPDLVGTLYRNGAGRWNIGDSRVESVYDADGMVSAFILDGRTVRFRNRFVRTAHYLQTLQTGAPAARGFGAQRPGGLRANMFRLPANTANTSAMVNPDQL